MNHRLLLTAAIALLLPIFASPSAADEESRISYSPRWLALVEAEPAFDAARPVFEAGDPVAVRELVILARGNSRLIARLAALAEEHGLTIPLIDTLDELLRTDPGNWGYDVPSFIEAIGPRRPEAVPLLVRVFAVAANTRGYPIAVQALANPADDARILAALVNVATGPDDQLATVALRRLPDGDPDVRPALGTIVARCAAFGLDARARVVADTRAPGDLPGALRTALNSCLDDAQRLRVVAAVYDLGVFKWTPDEHPLLRDLAVLTSTPAPLKGVPEFRAQIGVQLAAASEIVRAAREAGKAPPPDALERLKSDPIVCARALANALRSPDDDFRLAAVWSLDTLSPTVRLRFSTVLERAVRSDPEPDVRRAADWFLPDDRGQMLARVPDLVADCRADSPTLRETAARQLHELELCPKPVTPALLRAVAALDMAAREGLLRAIERAYAAQSDPVLSLQAAADATDSATRAYARAALRQLGPP